MCIQFGGRPFFPHYGHLFSTILGMQKRTDPQGFFFDQESHSDCPVRTSVVVVVVVVWKLSLKHPLKWKITMFNTVNHDKKKTIKGPYFAELC